MSLITDIKQKIETIGPGEFQEFCDAVLSKIYPGSNIHSLGMKSGTGKTTTGNPDSYFRIENGDLAGKYILVAYTTQTSGGIYNKIKEDIEKCVDESKTGLPRKDIAEIIVCHTSSNLKAGDDEKLHDLCGDIPLEIYGVDQLANLVYNKYPTIVTDFLHMPFVTGQIRDQKDFINIYDSSELAAPLNTPFLFREKECSEILESLKVNNCVVLTGKPGVGKTRLALEVCRQYEKSNHAELLCIKNNGLGLFDEFLRWVEQLGKYIIFIDDANDIKELLPLINFARESTEHDIRFVMTVRDYVKDAVIQTIRKIKEPVVYKISVLSDKEITELINKVLDIQNIHYVDQIVRIAEGNPRIAYMAGKLAIDNDLSKIYDVSSLLNVYYANTIDKCVGSDEYLCITAGILAIIHAVSLNDLKNLEEIFSSGIIDQNNFIQCCNKLVDLEVAEKIYSTIVFSDQCFANYMIYYTFFSKKMIPFSTILDIGFRHFKEGTVQATSVIINIFNNDKASSYLKDQIRIVWNKYKNGPDQALFESFAEVYHLFFPNESLLMAKRKIDELQDETIPDFIDFDRGMYDYSDHVLTLLDGYASIPNLQENAMELALQYGLKSETNLIKFKHWFNTNFEINEDSIATRYEIQNQAIDFMNKHCLDSIPASKVFLPIASEWLTTEFNPISMGRKHSLRTYHIVYQYSEEAGLYRRSILKIVLRIAKEPSFKNEIHNSLLSMLSKYSQYVRSGLDQKFTECDAPYIEEIINNLDNDLNKAVIVNRLIKSCSIHHYDAPWNFDLNSIFTLETWKVYSIFSEDYLPSELTFREFKFQRQRKIESFAKTLTVDEMDSFIGAVDQCISISSKDNDTKNSLHTINDGLRILSDALSDNHELSIAYLQAVQKNGSTVTCRPDKIFANEINRDYREFYDFIANGTYSSVSIRNDWLYVYFATIPEEKCDQWALEKLLLFLKDDSDQYFFEYQNRSLEFLLKFRKTENNIFSIASRIILEKKEYNATVPAIYFDFMFREGFIEGFNPDNLIALYGEDTAILKEVYLYELQKDQLSDYKGKYLLCFCHHDPSWLNVYCDYLFQERIGKNSISLEKERLDSLWQLDEHQLLFDTIFEYAVKTDDSMSLLKNCRILRYTLGRYSKNADIVKKQQEWYLHLVEKYAPLDSLKSVFFMCSDLDDDFKLIMIQKFLELNQNFEDFKKLPLFPNSYFVTGSFIPMYEKRKDFLNKLLSMMQGLQFLEHRNLIDERIEDLEKMIDLEQASEVVRKANGW